MAIVTKRKFRDFTLHVEFNCATGHNSGIYLRGRYEVRVADAGPSIDSNCRTVKKPREHWDWRAIAEPRKLTDYTFFGRVAFSIGSPVS